MRIPTHILAIDQGTSSTKTVLFDKQGAIAAKASLPLRSYHDNGFAEQSPAEIFDNVLGAVSACLASFRQAVGNTADIGTCGISNQRETFVVWGADGRPLHNAVLWQCKRSVEICERLTRQGLGDRIKEKTGLLIDPYFSATKLIWLAENNPRVRAAIDAGDAFFGTIDTWLLYNLTGGRVYATDHTNASRTMLFNLRTLDWDAELLQQFGLSRLRLPSCHPSAHCYGSSSFNGLFEKPLTITAMIGDSHAAAFGEGCVKPGMAKATLGTGCSILMDVGDSPQRAAGGMISTICWSTGKTVHYALEGIIVTCGATIEWLRNELNLFAGSASTEQMAASLADNGGVYFVPAFSGLGAPHWQMTRKASITGLTFGTGKNHLVRAALESIPFQIKDVIAAMETDAGIVLKELMVDGGISKNGFILGFLADLLGKPVVNIGIAEVSALGAAGLAGLEAGIFAGIDDLPDPDHGRTTRQPASDDTQVRIAYEGWKKAIACQ